MDTAARTINALFLNTCVIVVFAYLLTRQRHRALLFQKQLSPREAWYLGTVFGLMALVELYFASARFPYDTYTLIVTFAAVNSGLRIGMITGALLTLGSLVFLSPAAVFRTALSVLFCVLIGAGIRRQSHSSHRLPASIVAIVIAEAGAILLGLAFTEAGQAALALLPALERILANGFGVFLLQLIVNDAQERALLDQYRTEAERSRALLAEAQLADLRSRIHPHFLFNTLTSIAALCRIAPEKAEETIVQLSQLMRRAIETHPRKLIPLREELEYVREYIEIERLRLADRLCVHWKSDPACDTVLVPQFAIQILVENAINHGIAPSTEPGRIVIATRHRRDSTLIAVLDNGPGIPEAERRHALLPQADDRMHGLQILSQQLALLYDGHSRLRLFSRPERGTCAAFSIPTHPAGFLAAEQNLPPQEPPPSSPTRASGRE